MMVFGNSGVGLRFSFEKLFWNWVLSVSSFSKSLSAVEPDEVLRGGIASLSSFCERINLQKGLGLVWTSPITLFTYPFLSVLRETVTFLLSFRHRAYTHWLPVISRLESYFCDEWGDVCERITKEACPFCRPYSVECYGLVLNKFQSSSICEDRRKDSWNSCSSFLKELQSLLLNRYIFWVTIVGNAWAIGKYEVQSFITANWKRD